MEASDFGETSVMVTGKSQTMEDGLVDVVGEEEEILFVYGVQQTVSLLRLRHVNWAQIFTVQLAEGKEITRGEENRTDDYRRIE